MDQGAMEGLVGVIRRGAGLGEEEVLLSMVAVGEYWLGRGALEVTEAPGAGASLVRVGGRYRILARRGTREIRFAFAHELGHWAFRELARVTFASDAEEERAANLFAAMLLAPRALVTRAYSFFGERVDVIATKLAISQTSAHLRLGEVRGDPRAVVTKTEHVFTRNPSAVLTAERALQAARGKAARGLAKTRLRGGIDEGRVAVRAA